MSAIDPSLLKESNGLGVSRTEPDGSEVSSSSDEGGSRPHDHDRQKGASPEGRNDITQLTAHMYEDPPPPSLPQAAAQELSPDSPMTSVKRAGGRIPIELD